MIVSRDTSRRVAWGRRGVLSLCRGVGCAGRRLDGGLEGVRASDGSAAGGDVGRVAAGSRPGEGAQPDQVEDERQRARRVQQAATFALELAILPGRRWQSQATGARLAMHIGIDTEEVITDAVISAWELAREQPPPTRQQVYSTAGDAGRVVVGHGPSWSIVARSGGPFLVLSDAFEAVWRVDRDELWQAELGAIVSELIEVSQGRPAVD